MIPKEVQCIAFDLDGTLVDAYRGVQVSLNESLKACGYEAQDDLDIQRAVGWGQRKLIETFAKTQDVDKILSIYRARHAADLKVGTKFLPGVKDLLSSLHNQGFKLAICTNRPARFTYIILKILGVKDLFSTIVSPEDVEHPKPEPDMLFKVMKRFDLEPEQLLYVGDMVVDAETGQKAGVRTVTVTTGSSTREELEAFQPFQIVDSIDEILSQKDEKKV